MSSIYIGSGSQDTDKWICRKADSSWVTYNAFPKIQKHKFHESKKNFEKFQKSSQK